MPTFTDTSYTSQKKTFKREGDKFEGKQVGVCHSRKTFAWGDPHVPTWEGGRSAPGNAQPLLSTPLLSKGKQTHPFGVKHIYIYFSELEKQTHLLRYSAAPRDKTRPLGDPLGLQSRGPGNVPGLSWNPTPTPPGSRVMNRDLPPTSPAHKSFLFRDGSERNSPPFPNAPQCQGVAWTWSPTRDTGPFYRCAQLRLRG